MAYRSPMAGEVKVVEDGLEQDQPVRRTSPSLVWLLIGLAIGLGVGVLFTGGGEAADESPLESAPVNTSLSPAVSELAEEPTGIAEVVPDFPDTLVAVAGTQGGSLGHVIWPQRGDRQLSPLAAGDFGPVRFDSSGTWIALATNVPDLSGIVLSYGKRSSIRPVASGVTSFAWHDAKAAELSYTQEVDGEWILWRLGPDLDPQVVTRAPGQGVEVAAWGDWGWVIQVGEELTLLTPRGELKDTETGIALDSHPSGWIVVDDDGLKLVSAGGGVRGLDIGVASIGGAGGAEISPDMTKIALVGGGGVKVAPLDGEGEVIDVPFTSGFPVIAWTSDSRFIVLPWIRGVIVIDTVETGRSFHDLTNQEVRAVAVIPTGG